MLARFKARFRERRPDEAFVARAVYFSSPVYDMTDDEAAAADPNKLAGRSG